MLLLLHIICNRERGKKQNSGLAGYSWFQLSYKEKHKAFYPNMSTDLAERGGVCEREIRGSTR